MSFSKVAVLLPAVFVCGAWADVVVNGTVGTGSGGGTCGVVARYTYDGGGSVESSSAPCGGSVIPASPGATSAQLSVSAGPGASNASNSLDLSTGSIKASIYSVLPSGGGSVIDTLRDGVVFDNTNPFSVMLGVTWTVTGTIAPDPTQDDFFDLYFQGVLGGVATYTFHYDTNNGSSVNNTQVSGYDSYSVNQSSPGPGTSVTAQYLLAPGLNPLVFEEKLDMGGSYGGFDFGHTFKLGLDVPAGVTYTSDSGAFMTAGTTAAVPEPASVALTGTALLGAGLLGARRRRRRS